MAGRLLAWMATAAGLTLIVVLVTGGFRFDVGPLRVSAHGVTPPLLLMAVTAAALTWRGSARARDALAGITTDITTHAPAIAIVSAAAIAGVGVGFGTFAASSADPSAYVSHAALIDARTIDDSRSRSLEPSAGTRRPGRSRRWATGRAVCRARLFPGTRSACPWSWRCAPPDRRARSVSGRPRARGPGRARVLRDCRATCGPTRRRDCRGAPGLEPDRAVPDRAADERRPGDGLVDGGPRVRGAANAPGLDWRRPAHGHGGADATEPRAARDRRGGRRPGMASTCALFVCTTSAAWGRILRG